jgi:hypothetical protein
MPFHAFLSVWIGTVTHHQAIIQAWKEALLLLLAVLGLILTLRDPETRDRLRSWPVYMTGLFAVVAVLVTAFTRPSLTAIAFGAKTDLEFLVAFVLAILVASPQFVRRMIWAILVPSIIVIGFGLLQIFVLPPNFLTHFGYGVHTILPYETLDSIDQNLRFESTLGGPNQLGTYLILPMALAALVALRRQWLWLLPALGGVVVLIHTYSRAAWLGTIVAGIILVLGLIPKHLKLWASGVIATLCLAIAGVAAYLVKQGSHLQYYLLHTSTHSDEQHLESLNLGLTGSLSRPLGHGLGTAGPAFFHTGQGIIIENYYLQIAYETSWAGIIIFVLLLAATARELAHRATHDDLAAATLSALVGVSVTSLFLPAWTDSSTALIVWTAAGAAIGSPRRHNRV